MIPLFNLVRLAFASTQDIDGTGDGNIKPSTLIWLDFDGCCNEPM